MTKCSSFRRNLTGALAVVLLACSAGQLRAETIRIEFTDSGWYVQDGLHIATIKNYLAGRSTGNVTLHNYFVFDLAGVTDPIVGAELRLFNPENGFTGAPRDYTLFDVSTPIPTLSASHPQRDPEGIAIFNDLGSGTVYGSRGMSEADNNTIITIDLNADALAALNAARGGQFALGGDLAGAGPGLNFVFGSTGQPTHTRELVLLTEVVPEPSTFGLAGLGALGLLGSLGVRFARRRSGLLGKRRQPGNQGQRWRLPVRSAEWVDFNSHAFSLGLRLPNPKSG